MESVREVVESVRELFGPRIWDAANSKSLEDLERILSNPVAKEGIDYVHNQITPLMAAARQGSLSCVKLLLYHEANLFYSYSTFTRIVTAYHLAKKHVVLEQYLKDCQGDFQRCGYSRAYLEITVKKIGSNPNCTPEEIVKFYDCLRCLVQHCKFDVNCTLDEEKQAIQPLLLRVASAGNFFFVERLFSDFNADYSVLDPLTNDNLLHISLRKKAKERFSYVLQFPSLLHQSNKDGDLPLFIACKIQDDSFLSWFFRGCSSYQNNSRTNLESSRSFNEAEVLLTELSDLSFINVSFSDPETLRSPTPVDVIRMKPLAPDNTGNSIFHILASHDSAEILTNLLKVCSVEGFTFSALSKRVNPCFPLPIEVALRAKNLVSARALLELSLSSGELPMLGKDKHILKGAVTTKNIDCVRLLIEYGIHEGIDFAISIAATYKLSAILRLLLFWHTQISCQLRIHQSSLDKCDTIKLIWKQIDLQYISSAFLYDAIKALEVTGSIYENSDVAQSKDRSWDFLRLLGRECLKYFDENIATTECMPCPALADSKYMEIVMLNLNENHLMEVPKEVFQLPSMTKLLLKNNKLKSLPSSEDHSTKIYSAKLKTLVLDYNQLTSIPDDLVWGLASSLKDFSIQSNELEDIPPGLWLLPNLVSLKLSKNNLSQLHYFSHPNCFEDGTFMKNVALFEVDQDGSIQYRGEVNNNNDVEISKMTMQIRQLVALQHTLLAIKFPEGINSTVSLLNCVIQVYAEKQAHKIQDDDDVIPSLTPTPVPISHNPFQFTLSDREGMRMYNSSLQDLYLSENNFRTIPWDLPCLAPNLRKVFLVSNDISGLDVVHDLPYTISTADLSHNKIGTLCQIRSRKLPCGHPVRLLSLTRASDSSTHCQHCQHKVLSFINTLILDNNRLNYFQVIKRPRANTESDLEPSLSLSSSVNLPLYPNLVILSLESNNFINVPQSLHLMRNLSSLNLSYNDITVFPEEMGLLNIEKINVIRHDGIVPQNIPESTLNSQIPAKKIVKYLKDIKLRSKAFRHVKLMFVGEANVGKSSLLLSLTSKRGTMTHFSEIRMLLSNIPLATVGVDLGEYKYTPLPNKPMVTFLTWDFAGQEEYFATHQCFLTKRSIYMLLWNVEEGVEGLKKLRSWLENIECCAPQSPVVIVGTHKDKISPGNLRERNRICHDLDQKLREMYMSDGEEVCTFPKLDGFIYFLDARDSRQVEVLRDDLYEYALQFSPKSTSSRVHNGSVDVENPLPLLETKIPESYVEFHENIKLLADDCRKSGTPPVYTRKELLKLLACKGHRGDNDLDEMVGFLHDCGVMLHYTDNSFLEELYFLDPQWLCKMLAQTITIGYINPLAHRKNGFMKIEEIQQLYSNSPYCNQFVNLMRKFEVIFQLNERHILIPSLLPVYEEDACAIYSNSVYDSIANVKSSNFERYTKLSELNSTVYCRYYMLPFIPNGFFVRLIARLMSSDIVDQLYTSLVSDPLEQLYVSKKIHWRCWRNGVIIVWNDKEIFRVAPISETKSPNELYKITRKDQQELVESTVGLEIKVAVLPETKTRICSFLSATLQRITESAGELERNGINTKVDNPSKGLCIASWMLQRVTSVVDSVFTDWYEGFASKRSYNTRDANLKYYNHCTKCITLYNQLPASDENKTVYMFTSTFCCQMAYQGEQLECPNHGKLAIKDVAPDLVFCDFHPGSLFTDKETFEIRDERQLGSGTFGVVYKATFHKKPLLEFQPMQIAVKVIKKANYFNLYGDDEMNDQMRAWELYCLANVEARIMNKLCHRNILGLLGVNFWPDLSLLMEYAPMGDVKSILKDYKSERIRLSRRTLKATLIQVAEAVHYLHGQNFIYRDLKPSNVLVWNFPEPRAQWSSSASVYIKLADYGVSAQITPQGIYGYHGSEPYLPPEVVIYYGKKVYSTELDIYSFGMFMYEMISLKGPFSDFKQHIIDLHRDNIRPTIHNKLWPPSVAISDLMCWCWSAFPQHRPTFPQILQVLKSVDFTNMLAEAEIAFDSFYQFTGNEAVSSPITASCINEAAVLSRRRKEPNPSIMKLMSLIAGKQTKERQHVVQIWHGTAYGDCKVVQLHSTGITEEEIKIPAMNKKCISCIKVVGNNVWISTVGNGLFVYDATTLTYQSSWVGKNNLPIYSLLHVSSSNQMLAFICDGIICFDGNIQNNTQIFDQMDGNLVFEVVDGQAINLGVEVSFAGSSEQSQIWVCAHIDTKFYILDSHSFKVLNTIEYTRQDIISKLTEPDSSKESSILSAHTISSDLQVVDVAGHQKVVVASNWLIILWDAQQRVMQETYDCWKYCDTHYKSDIAVNAKSITSMITNGDNIYVGLRCGIIFSFKVTEKGTESLLHFHAYEKQVCSLMLLHENSTSSFPASISQDDLLKSISLEGARDSPVVKSISSDSTDSTISVPSPILLTRQLKDHRRPSNSALLVSIGQGYTGIMGSHKNQPPELLLPSQSDGNSTSITKPTMSAKSSCHLLIWSTEMWKDSEETDENIVMEEAMYDGHT